MAHYKRDRVQELEMARALGLDPKQMLEGTLVAEYTSSEQNVKVCWEGIMYVPVEKFQAIMTKALK